MATGDRDRVILAEQVAKCWQDAAFKAKLASDPASVLRAAGMEIPAGTTVKVYENTDSVTYLGLSHTLPVKDYETIFNAFLEKNVPLKGGNEIRLVQSAEGFLPIIIPLPPKAFVEGELTDADLMAMAGGDYLWEATNVATTTQAVAEANGAAVQNVAGATEAVAAAVIAVVLI